MKCNMGKTDRVLRAILGIVIIAVGWIYQSWWGAVGLVLVVTAAVSWCPLYLPFKISTCKVDEKPGE